MSELLEVAHALARRKAKAADLKRLARGVVEVGATRASYSDMFLEEIGVYVYAGCTLLHVAAAAHDVKAVELLLKAGADVRSRDRRGAEPLHSAMAGNPRMPASEQEGQAAVIAALIAAGADANALDKGGVAPLHRAVRNRCTAAVVALLEHGADANLRNKSGSKPIDLAKVTSGRGGTGSPEAKREQAKIIALLK
jgi:hypothetical protein